MIPIIEYNKIRRKVRDQKLDNGNYYITEEQFKNLQQYKMKIDLNTSYVMLFFIIVVILFSIYMLFFHWKL